MRIDDARTRREILSAVRASSRAGDNDGDDDVRARESQKGQTADEETGEPHAVTGDASGHRHHKRYYAVDG